MNSAPKKRFWTETRAVEQSVGFSVELDGRAIKTPGKLPLIVPTRALVDMIVAEWDGQGEKIDPSTMPATRASNSAIDTVSVHFDTVVDQLTEYVGSDLLCYRADNPVELIAKQALVWDPLLDWFSNIFGTSLAVTTGIIPIAQDPTCLEAVRTRLSSLTSFELTGMHDLITISGSAVIALAVEANHLKVSEGWAASRVDEDWQIQLWGEDDEANATAALKKADFEFAKQMLIAAKL
jgi:chaperone required for assembly of F1-ATPase